AHARPEHRSDAAARASRGAEVELLGELEIEGEERPGRPVAQHDVSGERPVVADPVRAGVVMRRDVGFQSQSQSGIRAGGKRYGDKRGGENELIAVPLAARARSEEHTSELQSHLTLVCRLPLEK